ncbi:MAG: sigma-70 family RNA polymerase sigma factor [Candidatus Gastranaerophilales bacterium]|nr:sigma-70 family RNA polymerase sigma factor [Candidatus Gastranaerophilales bacterium]
MIIQKNHFNKLSFKSNTISDQQSEAYYAEINSLADSFHKYQDPDTKIKLLSKVDIYLKSIANKNAVNHTTKEGTISNKNMINEAFNDALQNTKESFLKALKEFDPQKGRFFAFLSTVLRRDLADKEMASSLVYYPTYFQYDITKINKAKEEFVQKFQKEPSLEELQELTGYKKEILVNSFNYGKNLSLDQEINNEKSKAVLQSIIPDSQHLSAFDVAAKENFLEILDSAISKLTPFEQNIVKLKALGHSYKEIADILELQGSKGGQKPIDNALRRSHKKLKQLLIDHKDLYLSIADHYNEIPVDSTRIYQTLKR